MGSSGPNQVNPDNKEFYGLNFPVITIRDMVKAQNMLLNQLGIQNIFCVIGGSMGAMQTLEWAYRFPEKVLAAIPIAGSYRHSAQNIAFHEVGRQAIMADPDWNHGNYLKKGTTPKRGLAVARMAAHVTYLSEPALHRKFGRKLQNRNTLTYGFDANTYLYITRAMDYFDLAEENNNVLSNAFKDTPVKFCLISFTTDWLFPTAESRAIVQALNANAAKVSFVEIDSDNGHDAFLLDEPEFHKTLKGFLDGTAKTIGLI